MRVIKPLQLGLITRPFEYGARAYLGFSIIAAVPIRPELALLQESEMWQRILPELGEQPVLDAGIPKKRGEFLVCGSAHAPGDGPVESMSVRVKVGHQTKTLAVFGDRYFEGDEITRPEPFEVMPVDWRRAFGGEGFERNPSGKGRHKIQSGPHAGRLPLPNIEDPGKLMGLRSQRPDPAGFGPLDVSWPQRRKWAGTHDENWLKTRFPGFPDDIGWEHFNMASPDQWQDEFWTGGESFGIEGMHSELSLLEGEVPRLVTRCFFRLKQEDELHEAKTALSTLWFFPEIELLVLVYQGSIGVSDYDAYDVDTLMVAAEYPEQARSVDHYATVLAGRLEPGEDMLQMIRDEPLMPTGLARSPVQDVLEQLGDDSQSPLVRHIENKLDAALEDAREKTRELGHEFPDHAVPEHDLSMELPDPEDLEAFLNEKYQLMYDTMLEAYESRDEARARVEQELARRPELELYMDDLVGDDGKGQGPPSFSAQAMREDLQLQCTQMREVGADPAFLEAMLDDPDQLRQWQDAENGLKDLYRMGAHYQKPVEPLKDSTAAVEMLISLLSNGQSVSGKNFCGVDLSGLDLSGRDLSGIFLESAILTETDLSGANLFGAVLAHAHLRETNLEGARLDEANLGKATLIQVRAGGASLVESVLEQARIADCDFSGATISGMQVFLQARVRRCNFSGAHCSDLVFNEIELDQCEFTESIFEEAIFIEASLGATNWSRARLDKATFITCSARKANFSDASMIRAILVEDCDFSQANFRSAKLSQAQFRGASLLNCDFSRSLLDQSDFSEVNAGGSSFRLSQGLESRWVRADLRECDLSGANRASGIFHLADLRAARLDQANLYAADMARILADEKTRFDGALTHRMNIYPRLHDRARRHDH